MSSLFIPKKIRVGFQHREGTYTNKLAYVIYYDIKGKLRKEKSWQGWRDDKIEPVEFDNEPQDGFVLNKGITRYPWSSFGSNRSMIRIYDSRGIEFEVTPENLIGLLMETNCSKRGLEGEFVYAWCGTELVLLPCCSEEYSEAVKHTERLGKKISARDLKPGCSYTTKKNEQVIYMGRFPWFSWDLYRHKSRISQKKHIFALPEKPKYGNKFFPKDASFLAELDNSDPVQNYAELVDEFNADIHSSIVENWKSRPLKPTQSMVFKKDKDHWGDEQLARYSYTSLDGDDVVFWRLAMARPYHYSYGYRGNKDNTGYRFVRVGTLDTKKLTYIREGSHYHNYDYSDGPSLTQEQVLVQLKEFSEVDMVLTSGKKLHLKNIDSIARD